MVKGKCHFFCTRNDSETIIVCCVCRDSCQACYAVIKSYLHGNSRKNETYLARFIEFFKTQVGMGLNAEEVMIEMVLDNR